MKIELYKRYKTRAGTPVLIYAIHTTQVRPVHGAIYVGGRWDAATWGPEGQSDPLFGKGVVGFQLSADLVEDAPMNTDVLTDLLNDLAERRAQIEALNTMIKGDAQ